MKTFALQYKNILTSHIRTYLLFRAYIIMMVLLVACSHNLYAQSKTKSDFDSNIIYKEYKHKKSDRVISRTEYLNKMYGFWLGECIANWTGLVTEMDKIGSIGVHQKVWGNQIYVFKESI